jgi:WD40 repeat protein/tetratricopeptide (TPR) repeat protein
MAISPDGKTVLTGSKDKTARLWSAATGKELTPPLRHQGPVLAVAFSPDGKAVLTGSGLYGFGKTKSWGEARLWSVATGKELTPPMRHQGLLKAVAFSPDGNAVLTGSEGYINNDRSKPWGEARLWSLATGKELTPPMRHQGFVFAVAFSPDGKAVVTGSRIEALVWSAATGKELTPPMRHQYGVRTVAFSPDGKTFLTGSGYTFTGEARLWSSATGQALTPPLRHQHGVWAVAFSPDGKTFLTGSDDGTARLWEVPRAKGNPKRITLWIQSLTGMELDNHGRRVFLDAKTWNERRQQLRELGGPPVLPRETDQAWHRREAIEAEIAKQWFTYVWHLDRLLDAGPADGKLRKGRGRAHLIMGNWSKAAQDLANVCESPVADFWVGCNHARLRLYLGDGKGYQQACARMLTKWGRTEDPSQAKEAAWACALGPNSVADFKPVLRLAEMVVAKPIYWNPPTLGAVLYRAGRSEEAIKRLQEAVAKRQGFPEVWLFLAMAHHRLGHSDDAKTCLAKAVQQIDAANNMRAERRLDQLLLRAERRLDLLILRREAERILQKPMDKNAFNKPEREKKPKTKR